MVFINKQFDYAQLTLGLFNWPALAEMLKQNHRKPDFLTTVMVAEISRVLQAGQQIRSKIDSFQNSNFLISHQFNSIQ